jgi:hypothetical protein
MEWAAGVVLSVPLAEDVRSYRGIQVRTVDFRAEVAPNGQIAVPPEVAFQVPPGELIQVVLRWGDSDDNAAWRAAGRTQFEAAYTGDDSIYEQSAEHSAELVVRDAVGDRETLDQLARFEAVEAIRLGMAAAEDGRVRPARPALAELHEKLASGAHQFG